MTQSTRVWRAEHRYQGGAHADGVSTAHAFSFSGFYDPENVNFGLLVACNEETLAPGAGFAEHPHRDVEIVTWVVDGELEHLDSAGNATVVRPGDVQRLGAGSGVRHVERNAGEGVLRFLQMWVVPGAFGTEPEYEVVRGIADATPFALPRTEAVLHVRRLAPGEPTELPDAEWLYVHVVRGAAELDGELLRTGDAARIAGAERLTARAAGEGAELLAWEMSAEPRYG
ncbi:pirin family protein [Streptomyces sulphureus]|uniref:pirin family protein n=1 Tax=Streptomyces sulphureus TaxID=47758 RepID=UPI00036C40C5|nr:pirin family protein [Streptomyces sulphureus]